MTSISYWSKVKVDLSGVMDSFKIRYSYWDGSGVGGPYYITYDVNLSASTKPEAYFPLNFSTGVPVQMYMKFPEELLTQEQADHPGYLPPVFSGLTGDMYVKVPKPDWDGSSATNVFGFVVLGPITSPLLTNALTDTYGPMYSELSQSEMYWKGDLVAPEGRMVGFGNAGSSSNTGNGVMRLFPALSGAEDTLLFEMYNPSGFSWNYEWICSCQGTNLSALTFTVSAATENSADGTVLEIRPCYPSPPTACMFSPSDGYDWLQTIFEDCPPEEPECNITFTLTKFIVDGVEYEPNASITINSSNLVVDSSGAYPNFSNITDLLNTTFASYGFTDITAYPVTENSSEASHGAFYVISPENTSLVFEIVSSDSSDGVYGLGDFHILYAKNYNCKSGQYLQQGSPFTFISTDSSDTITVFGNTYESEIDSDYHPHECGLAVEGGVVIR